MVVVGSSTGSGSSRSSSSSSSAEGVFFCFLSEPGVAKQPIWATFGFLEPKEPIRVPRSKTSLSGSDRVFLGTKEPTKVLLGARKAL